MKTLHLMITVMVVAISVWGTAANAADLDPAKKEKMERTLVGSWTVPENQWKTSINFEFSKDRTFTCNYQEQDKDPEDWSGNWRVRTAGTGDVKAYLLGRSQTDPEKYMKAIVRTDPKMENFALDIFFDFKGKDSWQWQSKLVQGDAADSGDTSEGGDEEWSDDSDSGGDDWGDDSDSGDEDWE